MTKCTWSERETERQQIHFVAWTSISEELIQFPSKYKKCHVLLAQPNYLAAPFSFVSCSCSDKQDCPFLLPTSLLFIQHLHPLNWGCNILLLYFYHFI